MSQNSQTSAYDFDCIDLKGKKLPLRQFAGLPLLIVNTASLCGFSTQYKELENLWQRHKSNGFAVVAIPSNDFGQQEPGDNIAIESLCSTKFGVTFPVLQKSAVRGAEAHPLFKWLAEQGGFIAKPRWNFYKYIIGRDGQLKDWFSCLTPPTAKRFNRAISKVVLKD